MRTTDMAKTLHEAAIWVDTHAFWLEAQARRPNDDADPCARTVTFDDAKLLDDFLTGLRRLAPALERISEAVNTQPKLQLIQGGRG